MSNTEATRQAVLAEIARRHTTGLWCMRIREVAADCSVVRKLVDMKLVETMNYESRLQAWTMVRLTNKGRAAMGMALMSAEEAA